VRPIRILLCVVLTVALSAGPTLAQGADDRFPEDITFFLPAGHYFFSTLAVDPKRPDVAYMGTYEGLVYRTKDGGITWEKFVLVPEVKRMYQSMGERFYAGRVRSSGELPSVSYPEAMAKRSTDFLRNKANSDNLGAVGNFLELGSIGKKHMSLKMLPTTKISQREMQASYSAAGSELELANPLGIGPGGGGRAALGTTQFADWGWVADRPGWPPGPGARRASRSAGG
jgi:hypothetical protein